MNCRYHKEEEAKFICDKCKMPICEECATEVRGNKICKSCIDQAVYAERDHVERIGFLSNLVFFFFACIPGAAHMYLGLFRRGMQLMLTAIGGIVLVSYANMESFIPLIIIPTWFFAFFDAYSARRKMHAGEVVEDAEAYNYRFILNNKKVLGVALVVFGFIGLLNALDINSYNQVYVFGLSGSQLYWSFKRAIIPLLLVISGAMLLSKLKKSENQANNSAEN